MMNLFDTDKSQRSLQSRTFIRNAAARVTIRNARKRNRTSHHGSVRCGFTLVEILIVVVILGILASIVVPRFTSASEDARASALRAQLQTIRGQIEMYRARHGVAPALGTNNQASDWDVLINPSGELSYLQGEPLNPFTGHVGISDAASINAGWVWDASTGHITAPYFNELTGVYSPPGG
ncbi:MAG: prepilin-type N-terminal cleavage/methylation domain-containing protein [Planctomycetota bacterium]